MAALFAVPVASRAQDAATEERMNKLSAQIDVLVEAKEAQNKKIDDLQAQIRDLQNQLSKPSGNYASADDVKQLADAVKEVDRKRQEDNERVMAELEKLGKTLTGGGRHSSAPVSNRTSTPDFDAASPHMVYTVQSGDSLSGIVKAYREKGVKVTVQQVLAANPGLKPESMKPGQKVNIPGTPPQ